MRPQHHADLPINSNLLSKGILAEINRNEIVFLDAGVHFVFVDDIAALGILAPLHPDARSGADLACRSGIQAISEVQYEIGESMGIEMMNGRRQKRPLVTYRFIDSDDPG